MWNECLIVGSNRNDIWMLMHVRWLVLFCLSQFLLKVFLHHFKLFFLHVIILVQFLIKQWLQVCKIWFFLYLNNVNNILRFLAIVPKWIIKLRFHFYYYNCLLYKIELLIDKNKVKNKIKNLKKLSLNSKKINKRFHVNPS